MLWFGSIVLTIHCCLSLSIFLELDARCCWVRQGVWAILSRFPLGFFRKWVGCRRHHAPGCGPVWQGRREHPQRRFSLHTHLGVAELRERARERWAEPADTHFLAASDSSLSALGHTETSGPRLSDRWRDHAQAVWCPPEKMQCLSFPGSLTACFPWY